MFTVLALFYHGASYPSLQKPLLPNGLFPPMERHCGTAFSDCIQCPRISIHLLWTGAGHCTEWSIPDAWSVGQTSHIVFMRQLLWTVHSLGGCTGLPRVREWESGELGWYFCPNFIDPESWRFNHPGTVLISDSNTYLFFRSLCNWQPHWIISLCAIRMYL